MTIDDITFAKEFARRAHGHQLYGDEPYMHHLEQVAQLVSPIYSPATAEHGDIARTARKREQIMVIAYLHDVIEDTAVDRATLAIMFDTRVANAVQLISDPEANNRKERKRLLYQQIICSESFSSVWSVAVTVKVADRLANVISSCRSKKPGANGHYRMYQDEHAVFSAELHRNGMCDSLWETLDNWINDGAPK